MKAGDVIAEIETDKATMEVEAVDEGVLGKHPGRRRHPGREGERADRDPGRAWRGGAAPARPRRRRRRRPPPAPPRRPRSRRSGRRRLPAPRRATATMPGRADFRLAAGAAHGAAGRHRPRGAERQRPERADRAADIEAAQQGGAAPAARAPAPAAAAPAAAAAAGRAAARRPRRAITAPHTLVPHTTMRKVIARRLTEAKQTVPHFYVSMDIELDALLKLRARAECPQRRRTGRAPSSCRSTTCSSRPPRSRCGASRR